MKQWMDVSGNKLKLLLAYYMKKKDSCGKTVSVQQHIFITCFLLHQICYLTGDASLTGMHCVTSGKNKSLFYLIYLYTIRLRRLSSVL